MRKNKGLIIALFSSIFFVKVALCLATVYFQCNNQKLMNSLIMQVEIEHEEHSHDDSGDLISKESKFVKSLLFENYSEPSQDISHNPYILYANLYPINAAYTKILTPPPEQIHS